MAKLTVVEEREYDFVGKEGEKVHGWSYGAFTPNGETITFTSSRKLSIVSAIGYDDKKAVELDVRPRIWGGNGQVSPRSIEMTWLFYATKNEKSAGRRFFRFSRTRKKKAPLLSATTGFTPFWLPLYSKTKNRSARESVDSKN